MIWVLFLAGPVIWFAHFMGVYVVAEAACVRGEKDTSVFGLHPLSWLTLVATGIAVAVSALLTWRAWQRWRARRDPASDWLSGDDQNPGLALAGALLGVVFILSILFVGVPAAFLDPC